MTRPVVHALIPAAGKGKRFGGDTLKQYMPLAGRPVLRRAVDAVNHWPAIAGVTVVLAADDHLFDDAVGAHVDSVETAPGGSTRAESVRNGLEAIRTRHPQADWVLVHDAARPCLARRDLERLLEAGLASRDGAILAVPVGDTLKRGAADGHIAATVDREDLWAAQTPQLFRIDALWAALDAALDAGEAPTDEAGVMERAGARPLLVMGTSANFKITHPGDLALAEAWFRARADA